MIKQSEREYFGNSRGEPRETDEQAREATIEINLIDFYLINEAMMSLKVRCGQNATAARNSGYGSEGSRTKAELWESKAKRIDNLMSRIRAEMS